MLKRVGCLLAACLLIVLLPQSANAYMVENKFTRVFNGNWNCLDAEASQAGQNGGAIQQWECLAPGTAGANQYWYIDRVTANDNDFTVHNGATWGGKCLDANPSSQGQVYLWDCTSAEWQQWYIVPQSNGNTTFANRYFNNWCLTSAPVTWPGNGGWVGLAPCDWEFQSGEIVPILRQVYNSLD